MNLKLYLSALFCILMLVALSSGAITDIPTGSTVYIGEEGLDITATGVQAGDKIGWWNGRDPKTTDPADMITVVDPNSFYVSPVSFSGKTGPWYSYPDGINVFYVKEPSLVIRAFDTTADFDATGMWVNTGHAIEFRIENNLYDMKNRPGTTGAPLSIKIKSPTGAEFSSVSGFNLNNIIADRSPYLTGPVWSTAGAEPGTYTIYTECNANRMKDNNPSGGAVSEKIDVLIQDVNPLIKKIEETQKATPEPVITTPVTSAATTTATIATTSAVPKVTTQKVFTPPASPVPDVTRIHQTYSQVAARVTYVPTKSESAAASSSGFCALISFAAVFLVCFYGLQKK